MLLGSPGGTCQKDATACQWDGTPALHDHKEPVQLQKLRKFVAHEKDLEDLVGGLRGLHVLGHTLTILGDGRFRSRPPTLHFRSQKLFTSWFSKPAQSTSFISLAGLRKLSGRTWLEYFALTSTSQNSIPPHQTYWTAALNAICQTIFWCAKAKRRH